MAPSGNTVNCALCGLPTQHFFVCFFKGTCVLSPEVGHIYSYIIFLFSSNEDEGPWGVRGTRAGGSPHPWPMEGTQSPSPERASARSLVRGT